MEIKAHLLLLKKDKFARGASQCGGGGGGAPGDASHCQWQDTPLST